MLQPVANQSVFIIKNPCPGNKTKKAGFLSRMHYYDDAHPDHGRSPLGQHLDPNPGGKKFKENFYLKLKIF